MKIGDPTFNRSDIIIHRQISINQSQRMSKQASETVILSFVPAEQSVGNCTGRVRISLQNRQNSRTVCFG